MPAEYSVCDRHAINSPFLQPLKSVFTELPAVSKTYIWGTLGISRTQPRQGTHISEHLHSLTSLHVLLVWALSSLQLS